MLRAIIFDMDGVICDSEPLHMFAFQKVLKEEGIHLSDDDYYDRYLAFDDRGCFERIFRENNRPMDGASLRSLIERKGRAFSELMRTKLTIYPGVEAFVKKAEQKYSLGLASGARRLEIEFILKKANVHHCFSAVVSADDVTAGKPDPESFQKALGMLNRVRLDGTPEITPGECLVIEDSLHGIAAAGAAGMKSLAVTTSFEADQLHNADHVVDSLVGLEFSVLENLF
jgi:beta-phosphoglucomutase